MVSTAPVGASGTSCDSEKFMPSTRQQSNFSQIKAHDERLERLADRIKAGYITACTQAQSITLLVLAKAIRGELVLQDPNDESASAPLEHINAQRGEPTSGKKERPRKANTV